MKLRNLHCTQEPQLMIIPMIDVMFFLLVFFMISTLYMVEQRNLPIALPQATGAQNEVQQQVAITVTQQGDIYFAQEEIPVHLFQRRVQQELLLNPEAAFVLRADKKVEYGRVIAVLDELKTMGVRRVAVATEAKR